MIRRFLTIAFFLFSSLFLVAQAPATIVGNVKFERAKITPVKLFKVSDGRCIKISETTPSADGKFAFMFYPAYEGFYVVGRGTEHSPNHNYAFYLKAGDKLSLELNDFDYKLTGENTKQNKALYSWHQFIDSIYQKGINFMAIQSTYVDFFPQLESIASKVDKWWTGKSTGNPKFDAEMPGYMKMCLTMIATNFLSTPRSAHPSVEEFSPYYKAIDPEAISGSTKLVYSFPWGSRTLNGMAWVKYRMSNGSFPRGGDLIQAYEPFVLNDTLRGDMVLDKSASIKDYGQYKELMAKYGNYIITDSQKVRQARIVAPLLESKVGEDGYNFTYEDNHGKTVSLAGMSGKVVVVDVWATWCGPCKAQIPYLKALEEEMKGSDVRFVSISVDKPEDKKKWLHFIDTASLGGTQLFAGGWDLNSGIAKVYKITGIPRFMVFDKQGKIVSIDAPRPSDPALKKMLEKELNRR